MRKPRPGRLAVAGPTALVVLGLTALLAADHRHGWRPPGTPSCPLKFSEWSAPVNLGPVVNSSTSEAGAFITRDGLSLYFGAWSCDPQAPVEPCRSDGFGGFDIYVSERASHDDPWEAPQNLGPTINTSASEQTPTVTTDGHWLYFASDRSGTSGGLDLYASRRRNRRDDFGWKPPVNLGSGVNTSANEYGPALFEDDEGRTVTLYFSSNRLSNPLEDIFASTRSEDGAFGPAEPVDELNLPGSRSVRPFVWRNGLELLLDSNRPGTLGGLDLFRATRESTSSVWSEPVSLGSIVNSTASVDARPVMSWDGTELYFHSNRSGGLGANDLYRSTRVRLRGRK